MPNPKVNVNGKDYDTREEEFEIFREEWNEYRLMSGGRLRLKTVVQKIFQVIDEEGKPLIDQSGESVVFVRHNSIVTTTR